MLTGGTREFENMGIGLGNDTNELYMMFANFNNQVKQENPDEMDQNQMYEKFVEYNSNKLTGKDTNEIYREFE